MKTKKKTKIEKKAKELREAVRRAEEKNWSGRKRDSLEMVGKTWGIEAVKASDAKGLPTIEILAEREVRMVELDLDIPDKIADEMYEYGAMHIAKDRNHVINWVFNLGLKNFVESLKKDKKCRKR